MYEWFKDNDIGRKLQAAVEDIINGDGWGPFEGLQDGAVCVSVTLVKGQVIRFRSWRDAIDEFNKESIAKKAKVAAENSGIFEGPVEVTAEKIMDGSGPNYSDAPKLVKPTVDTKRERGRRK